MAKDTDKTELTVPQCDETFQPNHRDYPEGTSPGLGKEWPKSNDGLMNDFKPSVRKTSK